MAYDPVPPLAREHPDQLCFVVIDDEAEHSITTLDWEEAVAAAREHNAAVMVWQGAAFQRSYFDLRQLPNEPMAA